MHFYFYYSFVSISGYRGDLNPSFPCNGEQACYTSFGVPYGPYWCHIHVIIVSYLPMSCYNFLEIARVAVWYPYRIRSLFLSMLSSLQGSWHLCLDSMNAVKKNNNN